MSIALAVALALALAVALAIGACGGGDFEYTATVGWVQDGNPIVQVAIAGSAATSPTTIEEHYGDLQDAVAAQVELDVTTTGGTFPLTLSPSACAGHCDDATCGNVTAETETYGIYATDADPSGVALRLGSGECIVDGQPVDFEGR